MRDEVNWLAANKMHQKEYGEQHVGEYAKRYQKRHQMWQNAITWHQLSNLSAAICNMQVMFMSPEEKLAFKSSTYKFRNKNRNTSKTRKVLSSVCLVNLYLFYSFFWWSCRLQCL
jgi:hypothetical protein